MNARGQFETELHELKAELANMCRLTERMIEQAIEALLTRDPELGKRVGDMDQKVDEYEMDIEKKCMCILLRQQPVAKDLREVSCALKMITDIERFGDQASDIGNIVYSLGGAPYIKRPTHIAEMGDLAIKMAAASVNSFIKQDEALADGVVAMDDIMDDLFDRVKQELVLLVQEDSGCAEQAVALLMVAKYLERIADHAVNVAEWTKYNKTGVHIKY